MSKRVRFVWLWVGLLAIAETPAAPMWGQRMDFSQPDSSKVPTLVWGDEHYLRVESIDSVTLVRDSSGWLCYATVSDDSTHLVSTGTPYRGQARGFAKVAGRVMELPTHADISQQAAQSQSDRVRALLNPPTPLPNYPHARTLTGENPAARTTSNTVRTVIGLTIPVDFSDDQATIDQQSIDDMMNKVGFSEFGNNGSVYDFYNDVSNGHLHYTNIVVPYIRLPKTKAYYNNPKVSYGTLARELILDALTALNATGFDFSKITTDDSKNVFALNVLYAGGSPSAWATGLWPHKGSMGGSTVGGVVFGSYELTDLWTSPDIGVLCHENGHMLMGWPDLYDYSFKSQGTGLYDLMSSAVGHNPLRPDAWLRDTQGWDSVVVLDNLAATQIQLPSNAGYSAKYDNPLNAKEHFYVESCRKTGRGANLPDEGLMIWHIDENGSNNNYQRTTASHYKVSLEQADGKFDLESNRSTGAGDLYHSGYRDLFGPTTAPNSNWWSGKPSNFRIGGIGPVGDNMSFFWSGGAQNPMLPAIKTTKPIKGLLALYKEGLWTEIPTLALGAVKSNSVATTITPMVSGARSVNYAIGFDGYFSAPQDGAYTFTTSSDGAVRVWIDTSLQADQKMVQHGQSASFTVVLAKGYHLLRVNYLHATSVASLRLDVSGGGLTQGPIPSANLFHETTLAYANDPTFLGGSSLGLKYGYYEGVWKKLPNFDSLTPVRTGLTQTVNSNSTAGHRTKDYGMVFDGYVQIPKLGSYTFYLGSPDGSRMYLDGSLFINNDAPHSLKVKSLAKQLYPGLHALRVDYFQHTYSPNLTLYYTGPGIAKRLIPGAAFYNDSTQGLSPDGGIFTPDNDPEDLPDEPSVYEVTARRIGGMLEVKLPADYVGSAQIDLLDAQGRLLNSLSTHTLNGSNEFYFKHRGSSLLVIVRVRMENETVSKVVPLTF